MRRPMTWVYCEPKSRMKILECGVAVCTLGMRLRDAVLRRWIVRRAILRPEPALASYAALQLRADFFGAALLDGISAATDQ